MTLKTWTREKVFFPMKGNCIIGKSDRWQTTGSRWRANPGVSEVDRDRNYIHRLSGNDYNHAAIDLKSNWFIKLNKNIFFFEKKFRNQWNSAYLLPFAFKIHLQIIYPTLNPKGNRFIRRFSQRVPRNKFNWKNFLSSWE